MEGKIRTVVHVESANLVTSVPSTQTMSEDWLALILAVIHSAVSLVDEGTGDSTWAGVDVLVRAPGSKIHIPVMELERHVSSSVGKIPSDKKALRLRMRGDGLDIKELASVVLNAREEDKRGGVSVLVDKCKNALG